MEGALVVRSLEGGLWCPSGRMVLGNRAVGAGPAGAAAAGPKFGQKKWRPAYGAKRMTQNT